MPDCSLSGQDTEDCLSTRNVGFRARVVSKTVIRGLPSSCGRIESKGPTATKRLDDGKASAATEINDLPAAPRREYPVIPLVGVGALVADDSTVLLVKRRHEPARGLWSIPGGLIELGETAEAAARREVMEETGIDVQIERLFDVVDNVVYDDRGKIRFHYVLVEFVGRPVTTVTRPNSDASDVRWVRFSDLPSYQMTKTARRLIDRLASERGLAQK